MRRLLPVAVVLFVGGTALAQGPIFAPDSFIDPRQRSGPLFTSRLVIGAGLNLIDEFRPLHQDAGFLHVANSVYWSHFQAQYNHTETHGTTDSGVARVKRCGCAAEVYFPTPPPPDAVPAAPLPGSRDTVQFTYYRAPAGSPALRYRMTASYQRIESEVVAPDNAISRRSGRERSIGIDADIHLPIGGYDIFGTLYVARMVRTGTTDDRSQNEFMYTSLFPIVFLPKNVRLRTTLTVGGITSRGASGINMISPLAEVFWRHDRTRANLHLIYSPQKLRDGDGWHRHHQVAVFVERALVIPFHRR